MLALAAGSASAARVVNGGFERGDLSGWQKDFAGPGEWFAYSGVFPPDTRGMGPSLTVPAPPVGNFGAMSDQGMPSRVILAQDVKLKRNRRHRLSFQLAYANQNAGKPRGTFGPGFYTPHSFGFSKAARPNQQFRMDVLEAGAPIKSLQNADILERVYRTDVGDPNRRSYRRITANLTKYAGERVLLRFAVVVTEAPLNVGIDAVKVKSKRRG
jgi:hypothetical protein